MSFPFRRYISIHALREEGDVIVLSNAQKQLLISIHALREEGDCRSVSHPLSSFIFLSTPSARRATFSR